MIIANSWGVTQGQIIISNGAAAPSQQPFETVAASQSPRHYWKLDETIDGSSGQPTDNYYNRAADTMGNGDLGYFPMSGVANATSSRADGTGAAYDGITGTSVEARANDGNTYLNDRGQLSGPDFSLVLGYKHIDWALSDGHFCSMFNDYYDIGTSNNIEYGFQRQYSSNALDFIITDSVGGVGNYTEYTTTLVPDMTVSNNGIILNDGSWHLIGMSLDYSNTQTLKFYADGIELANIDISAWSGNWSANNPLPQSYFSPAGPVAYGPSWIGVDEVLMYQRAITSSEFTDLYTAWAWNGI